jgi:hypothetical protein
VAGGFGVGKTTLVGAVRPLRTEDRSPRQAGPSTTSATWKARTPPRWPWTDARDRESVKEVLVGVVRHATVYAADRRRSVMR